MDKIVLVGLGNPGEKFFQTRHNLGIDILRWWVAFQGGESRVTPQPQWHEEKVFLSATSSLNFARVAISTLFPLTFMNDSGQAVSKYIDYYHVPVTDVLIIHDELELQAGQVRFDAQGGSAKGHNGVKSIQQALGTTEIARLRLGVGRPPQEMSTDRFVLQQMSTPEYTELFSSFKKTAAEKIVQFITSRQRLK